MSGGKIHFCRTLSPFTNESAAQTLFIWATRSLAFPRIVYLTNGAHAALRIDKEHAETLTQIIVYLTNDMREKT
jgi:hypothetical protein